MTHTNESPEFPGRFNDLNGNFNQIATSSNLFGNVQVLFLKTVFLRLGGVYVRML